MNIKLPDGSKNFSLLQLIRWTTEPLDYLDHLTKNYGDIFTVKLLGSPPLVLISNPSGIQEIFSYDPKYFDVGLTNSLTSPLFGNNSLVLLNGERHRRERKMLMPPFHGEKVKSYAQVICQITETVANQWQVNNAFIAIDVMQNITLEVILLCIFGLSEGERYQQIKVLIADLLNMISSPVRMSFIFFQFLQKDLGSWSPWGKFTRCRQQIYDLLQAEIDNRRANPEQQGTDILSLMLSARDEDGQPMSDEQLRDEMITLLVAGHDTSSNSLAWAFYWIHKFPQVKEKLLQEIDSLGENPNPLDISQLPYLTAVCQETLRIYPVAPIAFSRLTNSTIKIMGYQFEPGTTLVPCIYLTHHREDIYPEPKRFLPERFLERKYSPYEFIPFGGGNRFCLGNALATLEMKLVLATILSRYQLALVDHQPVKPILHGATITPSNGVPLVMMGRRSSN